MKKTFTKIGLLIGLIIPMGVSAQTLFSETFNGTTLPSDWQQQSIIGGANWSVASFGGQSFAKISGYIGGASTETENWLISPSYNLSSTTLPKLIFTNASKFAGPDLQLYVSTNYLGTGSPAAASWTEITAQANWDLDEANFANPFLSSGEINLNTFMQNEVYFAFKYTSTTTESSTWEIDNFTIFDGTITPPETLTIAEIQATTSGDESDIMGTDVVTGGIVSAVVATKGFYIQDGISPMSGIYVYDEGVNTVAIGDSVLISGSVDEFAFNGSIGSATQIVSLTSFENKGAFTPYAAIDLSTDAVNDEQYEGMLVNVTNALTTTVAGGNFTVSDGSGDIKIDKFIFLFDFPELNRLYSSITGVVGHGYEEYKIYPRMASDLVISPFSSVNENEVNAVSVYPNTVSTNLVIANAKDLQTVIYSAEGKLMNEFKVNSNEYILNVENYKSGVYFMNIDGKSIQFIKK